MECFPCTIWTIVEFGHNIGQGRRSSVVYTSGFYGLTHPPLFENARVETEIPDRMRDG